MSASLRPPSLCRLHLVVGAKFPLSRFHEENVAAGAVSMAAILLFLMQLFPTMGFMESGNRYPWYGITVGDDARIYNQFGSLTGERTALIYECGNAIDCLQASDFSVCSRRKIVTTYRYVGHIFRRVSIWSLDPLHLGVELAVVRSMDVHVSARESLR